MTNQKPYKRTDRVGLQILKILGEITTKHINISHLGFITFTKVKVSPDLQHAKVFYSVLNKKLSQEGVNSKLNALAKAFRKYLGQEIRTKYTPDLMFIEDDSLKHEEQLMKIFHDLHKDDS
ncbi:MAG: 30S ribosome-binding factor RbfA [Candidatus Marinimicrobia bacterium]|nr:30S ribosome-binding factor RbfA [Candidatus Neomarinimicrobiota bacterium]MCH7763531.1 30S ribosome-binding factor RbfA [Candidatus Neomarinimicrobiota bacterium]